MSCLLKLVIVSILLIFDTELLAQQHLACKAEKNINLHINKIYKNPEKYLDGHCIFNLLDTIKSNISKDTSLIYLKSLFELLKIANKHRYIAEHLANLVLAVFYENTDSCLQLLNKDKTLIAKLLLCFNCHIDYELNGDLYLKKHRKKLNKLINNPTIKEEHKKILKKIYYSLK
jgi:hypothetical protein